MQETKTKKEIEFRLIRDDNMPPVIFKPDDEDNVTVVINQSYLIWLSLNRKIIAGCSEALFDKIDEMLTSHLSETRMFERMG